MGPSIQKVTVNISLFTNSYLSVIMSVLFYEPVAQHMNTGNSDGCKMINTRINTVYENENMRVPASSTIVYLHACVVYHTGVVPVHGFPV